MFATYDIPAGTTLLQFISGDLAPFTEADSRAYSGKDSDLRQRDDSGGESSSMPAKLIPGRAKQDFSVIMSSSRNFREEVFLGTARFVNVSPDVRRRAYRDRC